MYELNNIKVTRSHEKTGVKPGGQQWKRHSYQFSGSENWFSKFVDVNQPPFAVGTLIERVTYEPNANPAYGNNIDEMVVAGMPHKQQVPASANAPLPNQPAKAPVDKNDPIWFCAAYSKDLMVALLKARGEGASALNLEDVISEVAEGAKQLKRQLTSNDESFPQKYGEDGPPF